jgi:hypothetical protein
MLVPPSFRKVNPADQPVIQFSLSSSTVPISQNETARAVERCAQGSAWG